ncbi:uncharacterized protein Z520_09336 [Fonsecaea multimorphosa CBS 102226]|uniref:Swi5-domain-containing protein n=1 Tax=Fonsecaea multimorphosa CBS 102226 TaxID=1442371 RepID=A0A0D2ID33_9EURO|nr:uncharacterized protein Z520_09336 [Fonsecaea multimorphosa CBS 102226]KIX95026.1 hypothetical protein Z520_09336 [Fonsecaea multimorphosa CBS 102226]OAL20672.1 hypothetical protein AYO22_08681 [Fonsecaea multimorphosa]
MEGNTSSVNQSTGQQLPETVHCRTQRAQLPEEDEEVMQSSSTVPTIPLQPDQSDRPSSHAKQAKLLASIENLKSSISTTEAVLSTKLREITQLKSFRASTSNEDNQESTQFSSRQGAAPETAQKKRDSFVSSSTLSEDDKAALAHAHSIINSHISLLKSYNEIKNIAMGMLSLIAEKEGRRLKDVMDERGIDEDD